MKYLDVIKEVTAGEDPRAVSVFLIHSTLVTEKALCIARDWMERTGTNVDLQLLEEIGMLHDIGVFQTDAPEAFFSGKDHYVSHVTHGHRILSEHGLDAHARAAKNHLDVTIEEIQASDLPLPAEDHLPETVEEEILTLADYYYSKDPGSLFEQRDEERLCKRLDSYGGRGRERFLRLKRKYLD